MLSSRHTQQDNSQNLYLIVILIYLAASTSIYKDASCSSTTNTFMLPFRVSAHRFSASCAFSSGNTCDTSFFKSRIPPLRQAMAGGQVSR